MYNPLSPDIRRQLMADRKSFTRDQEQRFFKALKHVPEDTRLLCELLYLTGCRLSEALALRLNCLDTEERLVVFHTLKQRNRPALRAVPVPQVLMQRLIALPVSPDGRFWPYSRWTARRRVKAVLEAAQITGRLANTRTFRHSYNDRGKLHNIPDHVRRALMGHRTQPANDAYGALIGSDLRDHARSLWESWK